MRRVMLGFALVLGIGCSVETRPEEGEPGECAAALECALECGDPREQAACEEQCERDFPPSSACLAECDSDQAVCADACVDGYDACLASCPPQCCGVTSCDDPCCEVACAYEYCVDSDTNGEPDIIDGSVLGCQAHVGPCASDCQDVRFACTDACGAPREECAVSCQVPIDPNCVEACALDGEPANAYWCGSVEQCDTLRGICEMR